MFECKLLINDLDIRQGDIDINAAVLCTYNPNVISPKVKIVFEADGEIRRFPFPVQSYFKRRESDEAVIICSYSYTLDYLFVNHLAEGEISAHLELYYGNEYVSELPMFVSKGLTYKNRKLKISEEYIGDEIFNGILVYGSKDTSKPLVADGSNFLYSYGIRPEKNIITLSRTEIEVAGIEAPVLSEICKVIFLVLNILLCILLLPYFVADGILAGLGLLPKHKYRPVEGIKANIIAQVKANITGFLKTAFKSNSFALKLIKPTETYLNSYYKKLCKQPVVENRISFLSGRRDELSGNEKFVYNLLKDEKGIDFQFLFFSDVDGFKDKKNIKRFVELYATSKIVIVDDYYDLLNTFQKRDDVTLFQLWHACGAFKTFGFSRLGKKGSPRQISPNHRMYDYTIVSSSEVVKHYAEGFGINDGCVLPTGIPRTDIFMDKEYAENVRTKFYQKYPHLVGKKIVLFAPTFRGNGKVTAYYPLEVFNPQKLADAMGEDTAVILKLHPFCLSRYKIDEKYKERIIDLSDDDELNDLLFVTDLLITDYSSVVFEASLLNIPMLFYSYDLYKYISERDFYYDYADFVPGKICYTEKELIDAAVSGDCEVEKVEPFKLRYFESIDGKSSQRVADAILKAFRE